MQQQRTNVSFHCPACGAIVEAAAINCRTCGEFFDASPIRPRRLRKPRSNAIVIVLLSAFGVCCVVVLLVAWKYQSDPAQIRAMKPPKEVLDKNGRVVITADEFERSWGVPDLRTSEFGEHGSKRFFRILHYRRWQLLVVFEAVETDLGERWSLQGFLDEPTRRAVDFDLAMNRMRR